MAAFKHCPRIGGVRRFITLPRQRLESGEDGGRPRTLLRIQITVIRGAINIVGPVVIAVVTIHAAGDVGPDFTVDVLHLQEIAIAKAHFLQQVLASRVAGPGVGIVFVKIQQGDAIQHRHFHPFAQVTRIVPAADGVNVLPIVPPPRIVQVAGRMHKGNLHAAALVTIVADGLGNRAAPHLVVNRKLHGVLVANGDLVKPRLMEVAEIRGEARAEIRRFLL